MSNFDDWLTLTEAARQLGVHASTLRRWTDKGKIEHMLTPGGHRRFAQRDVDAFLQRRRQKRPSNKLEKIWAEHAITHTRTHMDEHRQERWLAENNGRRDEMRTLGRRLMGVLMQYIADDGEAEQILEEAEIIGRKYGRVAVQQQMALTDALQATMFFRDSLIEAAIELPDAARVRPRANMRLLRRINTILNVVQLAVAEAYEQPRP